MATSSFPKPNIGKKHTLNIEYFWHRQKVLDRKREIAKIKNTNKIKIGDKTISEQELWLEPSDFKPIYIPSTKKRCPLWKKIKSYLFELRP